MHVVSSCIAGCCTSLEPSCVMSYSHHPWHLVHPPAAIISTVLHVGCLLVNKRAVCGSAGLFLSKATLLVCMAVSCVSSSSSFPSGWNLLQSSSVQSLSQLNWCLSVSCICRLSSVVYVCFVFGKCLSSVLAALLFAQHTAVLAGCVIATRWPASLLFKVQQQLCM